MVDDSNLKGVGYATGLREVCRVKGVPPGGISTYLEGIGVAVEGLLRRFGVKVADRDGVRIYIQHCAKTGEANYAIKVYVDKDTPIE